METHQQGHERRRSKKGDFLLRKSEVRFRRLFETAQDGILLLDGETGKITEVNQFLLDLLGYTRRELLGKRLWELGFLKDIETAKAAYLILQKTGYVRYDDLPLATKDGRNMEVEFISNVYLVDSKKVIQCNIRDVSEKKRLDHLKDDFLATVSHEIRIPLSIVKMGMDSLEETVRARNREENEIFALLKRNTIRLEKLVNDLLDLSRFESGKMKLCLKTIQIAPLIEEVIQGSQSTAKKHGLILKSEYDKDLPLLQADPDLLIRVLTNLLDNALRFAASKITIEARKVDADLKISVINDGPGIKPEQLSILFDKFIQINRPQGGVGYKGTGLGLAICSEIIKLLGGKIWAESLEDQGSQFHFSIPITRDTA